MNIITRIFTTEAGRERRELYRIIKKADHAHKTTGKQHFVVRVDHLKGVKFMITNRELNKAYNKRAKKMNHPRVDIMMLLEIAVYKTGAGTMSGAK